jgi:cell division protein FtsA
MEENYIVAFEIGSSKIKGALVVNDPTGMLNVVAVQEEHVSESVRYGQIKNVEDVSGIIDSIRQKLEKSQAILPRKINGAYIGLSGSTVCSCLAEASLHFDIEEAITADTVAQLKAKAIASLDTDREVYDAFPRDRHLCPRYKSLIRRYLRRSRNQKQHQPRIPRQTRHRRPRLRP